PRRLRAGPAARRGVPRRGEGIRDEPPLPDAGGTGDDHPPVGRRDPTVRALISIHNCTTYPPRTGRILVQNGRGDQTKVGTLGPHTSKMSTSASTVGRLRGEEPGQRRDGRVLFHRVLAEPVAEPFLQV